MIDEPNKNSNIPKIDNSIMRGNSTSIPKTETIRPNPAPVTPASTPVSNVVDHELPATVSMQPKVLTPEQREKLIAKKKVTAQNKRLFGLVSLFLLGLMVVFFLVFILIYSVTSPENNPFIRLFGLEVEQWIPFLIKLVSVFFGFAVLVTFFIGLIGVFKIAMSPKDDMVARKKGIAMSMVGSALLIISIVTWMFTYLWLDSKRALYLDSGPVDFIETKPEQVTGLTAPQVIEFSATPIREAVNPREKEILSYVWYFGDGTKQTGENVSHEYVSKGAVDGSYAVTLSVRYRLLKTGEELTEDFHKTIVFDNEKVAAVFTASEEEGAYPLDVTFDASESKDPDGTILEYLWDLNSDGDFDDASGVNVNYTFSQVGEYMVKLKVVDDSNDFAITEKKITVTESTDPRAIIDVPDNEGGKFYVDTEYTFDASGSSSPKGPIVKYRWDFGDGTTSNTRTFTHKFSRLGTYIVQLDVEDIEKTRAVSSIQIDVLKPSGAPVASITPTPNYVDSQRTKIQGQAPFDVIFSSAGSTDPDDDIISYEWDYDSDGEVDEQGEVVSYTFEEAGEYKTTLLVTDSSGNKTSRIVNVIVAKQGIRARLTASLVEGEVPLEVTFDASASSYTEGKIISYKWNFGDGSLPRSADSKISYQYTSIGEFVASVTVRGEDGTESVATVNINVRPISVRACFESSADAGVAPLSMEFRATCSKGTVSQYTWKVNNVVVPANPPHRMNYSFNETGIYSVELTVRDPDGVIDRFTKVISITQ